MPEQRIDFEPSDTPALSIAVLVTREPEMVGRCFRAIARARAAGPPSEVVLVLAADQATRSFVHDAVRGATLIEAPADLNVGLGPAQNLAFARARAGRVVLLHEDSEPDAQAFEWLAAAADANPDAAVIGARMVGPRGELQQVGAVVWSDGRVSTVDGRVGQRLVDAGRSFQVDACGMAGTLVDRAAWEAIGGFDERFFPAFYGDIDFCLGAWGEGRSVICEPRAEIRHEREAMLNRRRSAAGTPELRSLLLERQRTRFTDKWGDTLGEFESTAEAGAGEPGAEAIERAVARSAARDVARARRMRPTQSRPVTRIEGRDADVVDAEVERRLLRAQIDLLRDFADRLQKQRVRAESPAPSAASRPTAARLRSWPVTPVEAAQSLRDRFPPPQVPWTYEYLDRHTDFLTSVLDSPDMIERFRRRAPLPDGYGIGLDERVVEYPWTLSHGPFGSVLDAGSVLNHPHVLDRFQPLLGELTIATLAPEERSYPERGVSYVYSDLRDLPFRDARFDSIVCISTLDHVGMDNRVYGSESGREGDPRRQAWAALGEMRRVLRPGGTALVTVPYGRREDHVWLRQLDRAEVEELIAAFEPRDREVVVYRYTRGGWALSDFDEAADSRYRDFTRDPSPVGDLAAAARAVACLRLTS